MTPRRALLSDVLWSLVAVGILAAGAAGFVALGALREPIVAAPVERVVPPVDAAPLRRHDGPVPVVAEGFVRPVREVGVAVETPGRVVEVHPALRARGRVREGEVLVRLDDRAAQAALTRAESDIASTQARLELNTTQLERTRTLRRRGVVSEDALDQALSRQSELEGTLASLASARRSAEVALDATRVLAPFDGRVLSKRVEVGEVVGAGQAVATLASVDELEVTVALEEDAAALVPGLFDDGSGDGTTDGTTGEAAGGTGGGGAPATVTARFADRAYEYPARVARVVPALDAATRTLDVTVALTGDGAAVDGKAPPSGTPPALVNAYASVRIDGAAPAGEPLYAVPSSTVREAGTLWLVAGGALRIVDADVLRVEDDTSYVRLADAPPEALLVTSVLPAPVDGMPVAVTDAAGEADEGDGEGDGTTGDLTLLREPASIGGASGSDGAGARVR